tara:strand:+ start:14975 stop:16045 length:1071 start_codon:yes stop_codon:yes gene_type:complete
MPSYDRRYIFRFISQLLHPSAAVDDSYFPAPQIFWDRLVHLGSNQLVLPAIYQGLKRKKLESYAPKDLVYYLREIKDLNQNRNYDILKQINFLSDIFKRNQIDYVFLKGAAMLIKKPYDSINERMVGDIDILVSEKQVFRAQQLLLNEGFEAELSNEFSFTKGVFSDYHSKHLKRISHPSYIAAVEIHRRLLIKENNLIPPTDVLENKVQCKFGQWIPSKQHLWQHAILNWQYNDNGINQNFLAFRTILDVLYLEPKDLKLKLAPKAIKEFYSLLSLYYVGYKTYYPLKKLLYKWKLKSIIFENLYTFFINLNYLVSFGFSRIFLLLSSKTYRKRVLKNPKLFGQRILSFLIKNFR